LGRPAFIGAARTDYRCDGDQGEDKNTIGRNKMIKSSLGGTAALVSFELPPSVFADSVSVCGDFNDWLPGAQPLARLEGGGFRVVLELPVGRRWRFRYLLDGGRWENDWAADDYIPNHHGGHDSVVDLTSSSMPPASTSPEPPADLDRGSAQDTLPAAVEEASPSLSVTLPVDEVAAAVAGQPSAGRAARSGATAPSRARKRVAAESSGSPAAAPSSTVRTRKAAARSATPPPAAPDPTDPAVAAPRSRRKTPKKPTEEG
jgi:hypothetical protein